jgi:Thioesterase-like superfamily
MAASFTPDGDRLVPSTLARGPWSDEMVNGHHIGGLVAWGVERDVVDPELQVARLTVDMFRPVPMRPLSIRTHPIREGRRLRVLGVSILDGDLEVTHGTALLLRRAEHPDGDPWTPPDWEVPTPDAVAAGALDHGMSWEIRTVTHWNGQPGQVWLREFVPFVEGQELTPLVRAGLMADFAHPIGNSGRHGLSFINADLTVYLARYPVGEWIGVESAGHLGDSGIGIGSAWMHDLGGRFAHAVVAGTPDPRLRQRMETSA